LVFILLFNNQFGFFGLFSTLIGFLLKSSSGNLGQACGDGRDAPNEVQKANINESELDNFANIEY